jgi:hypothetical protein
MLLNLETFDSEILTPQAGGYDWLEWEGDTLHAFNIDENAQGGLSILYDRHTLDGEHSRRTIYDGKWATDWTLSPDNNTVAVRIQDEDKQWYWAVYRDNQPIFDARDDAAFSGGSPSEEAWSGDWIHLDTRQDDKPTSIAVNLRTGELVPAPQPSFLYLNESPDGAWWLYWGPAVEYNDYQSTTVLVQNITTGEVVTLVEANEPLYVNWWHWRPNRSFVWSPVVVTSP